MGTLPANVFDTGWPEQVTNDCVLIKERRRHCLEHHAGLVPDGHDPLLIQAIHHPDEVHRNTRDVSIATMYQAIPGDASHWLRIALWISHDPDLRHSIHSMSIARWRELIAGREAGRKVWP